MPRDRFRSRRKAEEKRRERRTKQPLSGTSPLSVAPESIKPPLAFARPNQRRLCDDRHLARHGFFYEGGLRCVQARDAPVPQAAERGGVHEVRRAFACPEALPPRSRRCKRAAACSAEKTGPCCRFWLYAECACTPV